MPRQVTIAQNARDVVLPNGIRYQGGTIVTLSDKDYSALSASFKQANLSADSATPLADYFSGQQVTTGETCIPRLQVGSAAALVSGTMLFTFWNAAKTETVNTIIGFTNNTAAGATPTYAAMGIYKVNADGSLTLLGQCANDTTLFNATFTQFNRAVTTPFQKVQGQRYGFAYLVVSGAAMPNIYGYNGTVVGQSNAPRLTGTLAGQSVLPASITAVSLASTSQMLIGGVSP